MPGDASFDDGGERPLFLAAMDDEGLAVISALAQDAVFRVSEMRWQPRRRRFAVLINRFRWEDRERAEARGRPYERVRSLLVVDDVLAVRSQGIDRSEADMVLSLLSMAWEPGVDGAGRVLLTLAGDGAVALEAECLDVTLQDVTRPYAAPSGRVPAHDLD
jgi:hypothetical protein